MLPTQKKDWILDNKCNSLPCNSIEKIGVTLIALFSLLVIEIMKEPSASVKPVIQFGFNGKFNVKEFVI
jgi:hypothetical protein